MNNKTLAILLIISLLLIVGSCKKKDIEDEAEPSINLAIDSLVASNTDIVVWEEIFVTAYTKGENLTYTWSTNHGSMTAKDSVTVKYWACYSCIGLNTIKCEISNEYGTISDTIMINVSLEE